MYVTTDLGTVSLGQTVDAVISLIPRIGAMVPGGGHDAGYQFLFDGGVAAANGVAFAEAYYAMASSRVNYMLPSVNGFSVGVSYTPDLSMNTNANIVRQQATNPASHGETVHAAVSYAGESEGISYTIALGSITGNSQGNTAAGTLATFDNNDLSAVTGAVKIVSGNFTIGAHWYNNGDSFGAASDAIQAKEDGYTIAVEYAMGNITLGALYGHQELVRGTRAATNRATPAASTAGQVFEDDVTIIGVGYNMGGGVSTFVQYNQMTHSDGTHATVTDVDPSVLIAGISLGF
jgi:predicted porin